MSDKWEITERFLNEYRRRWKKYEDIDVKKILELYIDDIERDLNDLINFERSIHENRIIGKKALLNKIDKIKVKLKKAIEKKNIPPEQMIKIDSRESQYLKRDGILIIRYRVINDGGKRVSISFPKLYIRGFEIDSYPEYKILDPLDDFIVEYRFRQKDVVGGSLNIDLGKIHVNIGREIRMFPVGQIRVDIEKLFPKIRVEKTVYPREVYEGDVVNVSLKIENIGRGDAVNITVSEEYPEVLDKRFPYIIDRIKSNESIEIKYRVKAYKDKVLISEIIYHDVYGGKYSEKTHPIKFFIKEKPREEGGERREEVREKKEFSVEDILSEISKLGFSAAVGYIIGSKIPSKKYRRKKVFIESSLPHTKLKRNGEEVTVVFEHPIAVVHEEKNGIVVLRRANLPEIISSIDGWTAKRLQEIFIDEMAGIFKSWRPSRYVNIGKISTEKYGEEREIEKLKKICEKYGEKIDMKKLGKIPLNPILKTTYEKKGLFGKKLLEAYVYTLSRPEKMYFYNIDHQPFTLTDINKIIEKYIFKKRGNEIILIFASITGWMEEAIEHINGHQDPTIHIMLVDLKTQNVYYNNSKQILRELAEKMGMIEIYIPEISETENLDYLLLTGKIREKQYYKMLQEILAKKGSLEKSVRELR